MSPRRKPVQHEFKEQKALFDLARLHRRQYPILRKLFAVPNGEMRPQQVKVDRYGRLRKHSPVGKKLKESGVKPGVLDVFFLVARRGYLGLIIEMKYGDNDLSEDQQDWKGWFEEEGYLVVVCWSTEEAWEKLIWYISGRPTKWERYM